MSLHELQDGDVTFQPRFDLVGYSDTQRVTNSFKPPKGRKFVVLLLGTVETSATTCDPIAMLGAIGFVRVHPPQDERGEVGK